MRIGRTLPPAAAPIPFMDVLRVLPACFQNDACGFQFEEEIKQEFGQPYCLLVSSGKAALVLILKALRNLYPGRDEVLIPAFTCYSVPAAIKKAGLKIKLCDTGTGSLDLDKKQLRKIVETDKKENKILCVLVTHFFGCPADFAGIKEIVGDKIPIVEDAAQAMGEEIGNKKIGTLGDAGFFSLGRGKALSTIEGGVIVTSREDLDDELTRLSKKMGIYSVSGKMKLAVKAIFTTFMQRPFLFWLPKALPFLRLGETIYEEDFPIYRMSFFQKSLARNWQERLKGHQKVRRKHIKFWQEYLPQNLSQICSRQKRTSLIRFPVVAQTAEEREWFCKKSEETGCGIMRTYPLPINEISELRHEFAGEIFPNAKLLSERLMTIPVHEYVKKEDMIRVFFEL